MIVEHVFGTIKRDLGYKPVKSIEQGKLEILEWLKSEKF